MHAPEGTQFIILVCMAKIIHIPKYNFLHLALFQYLEETRFYNLGQNNTSTILLAITGRERRGRGRGWPWRDVDLKVKQVEMSWRDEKGAPGRSGRTKIVAPNQI